ncbi:serine/threonine-protein kinase Nek5, partial [Striga asiatica]
VRKQINEYQAINNLQSSPFSIEIFMEHDDRSAETDRLERGLLLGGGSDPDPAHDRHLTDSDEDEDEEPALYAASFAESEEKFVKYQTARWVSYSLLLILAWGIGLFMLVYLPVRRYVLRRDIRSRRLYITPNSIVYKVNPFGIILLSSLFSDCSRLVILSCFVDMLTVRRPMPFPCFGVLKKENHILLPSVANVLIEQGYLQSVYGVYSIRIENIGVTRPPSDDVQILGVANPHAFRKAVLIRLANMRAEVASGQDNPTMNADHPSVASTSPLRQLGHDSYPQVEELAILQKLEEVGSSVKRVETLIQEQNLQTT